MTLTATTTKVQYAGNDSTTEFAVSFVYWDDSDLRVISTVDATGVETIQTITTHYTLVGGSGSTGTLTMVTAPATGETLTIKSNVPQTQNTDLPLGGSFPSTSVEQRLDKITRLVQQHEEEIARAVLFSESSTSSSITIPEPSAEKALKCNSGS